jgi:hypothetical protein
MFLRGELCEAAWTGIARWLDGGGTRRGGSEAVVGVSDG